MEQKEKELEKNNVMRAAGMYLISLICKALHGEKQNIPPEGCTLGQVYTLARNNAVEAISFMGVEESMLSPELLKVWKGHVGLTMFRQVSFDAEREKILAQMSEKGISYLPLKGILLVNYYPKPGMRSMADNDILYGILEECPQGGYRSVGANEAERELYVKQAQTQVMEIMQSLGYRTESLYGNHDCYMKEPCFNFEMHRQIMSTKFHNYKYFDNIWSKAIPDPSNKHAFSLTDEDEYIYLLAHAYKHFDNLGCGIRCAIDEYVFLKKKAHRMNWDYVQRELEEIELTEFEKKLKDLAFHAFEEGTLNSADEEMLFYMLGCGTYGNEGQGVNNALDKIKGVSDKGGIVYKLKYWKSRLFWSKQECKDTYPFFYKHYWLIWLLPFYRVIRGLIIHPGKLWKEFVNVWKHK